MNLQVSEALNPEPWQTRNSELRRELRGGRAIHLSLSFVFGVFL